MGWVVGGLATLAVAVVDVRAARAAPPPGPEGADGRATSSPDAGDGTEIAAGEGDGGRTAEDAHADCPPMAVCEALPSEAPPQLPSEPPAEPPAEPALVAGEPPTWVVAGTVDPYAEPPAPAGYHLSSEPSDGLLTAGVVIFGLGYLPGLVAGGVMAAASGEPEVLEVFALPFVVPAIMVAVPEFSDPVRGVGAGMLIAQGTGLMLVGLSLAVSTETLVPDEPGLAPADPAAASAAALTSPKVVAAPLLSPSVIGLTVGGTM